MNTTSNCTLTSAIAPLPFAPAPFSSVGYLNKYSSIYPDISLAPLIDQGATYDLGKNIVLPTQPSTTKLPLPKFNGSTLKKSESFIPLYFFILLIIIILLVRFATTTQIVLLFIIFIVVIFTLRSVLHTFI